MLRVQYSTGMLVVCRLYHTYVYMFTNNMNVTINYTSQTYVLIIVSAQETQTSNHVRVNKPFCWYL